MVLTMFRIGICFEIQNPFKAQINLVDEIERMMTYISFILKPWDLFGMDVVTTSLYFMKPADYTNCTYFFLYFFRSLRRMGSVLCRSELDLIRYIW